MQRVSSESLLGKSYAAKLEALRSEIDAERQKKQADLGIAMGAGAPAVRAVAQLVLVDNKFSSLPSVTAEGRRVLELLLTELPVKTAARLAAEITGESKNALYALALSLRQAQD